MMGLNVSPVAYSTLSIGILFGLSNIALSRNPEVEGQLFTNALIAFALIESFVFINYVISFFILWGY